MGEQTHSLSNKELRAVEVLYADSGINFGMFTVGDEFGIPKVFIIRTTVVISAKGENAGQKRNKGIYRQFVATTSIARSVFV